MTPLINHTIITIDGPSAVGKGTVAKLVARALGFRYMDTGAMYRTVALKIQRVNPPDINNDKTIDDILKNIKIEHTSNGEFLLDSANVTHLIRTPEISDLSSKIAAKSNVRKKLTQLQRAIGSEGKIVAEGRDMGTYVFPEAKYKFYLDADLAERAKRRQLQMEEKVMDLPSIIDKLRERDKLDMNRKEAPLHPANNAVIIDTTNLNISEVVGKIVLTVGGKTR